MARPYDTFAPKTAGSEKILGNLGVDWRADHTLTISTLDGRVLDKYMDVI